MQLLIELLVGVYFLYVVIYTFTFSIAALFYRNPPLSAGAKKKFAVFIPAYKEDEVILSVASNALKQIYPPELYSVIIIADSLRSTTMQALRALPLQVVEVNFESSTKVKSLNFALKGLDENYDYAVILDADNVMLPDFLDKLNGAHLSGVKVIQGQRMPKNKNNSMSLLDGLSEAINNHIYRQGSTALHLSASINGSGISFPYSTLKGLLAGMNSVGGFDRELELLLLERNIPVVYFKDAKVLDEKVQKTEVFENQRKRWISSQYHYLAKYFKRGLVALLNGNFSYFNSSVLRNIQLPRLINLGLITVISLALFFIRQYLIITYWVWPSFLILMMVALIIAIPKEFFGRDLLKAIFRVPGLFLRMTFLLFKLKGANKKFIHTPHAVTDATSE